jgi:hypothetical protein
MNTTEYNYGKCGVFCEQCPTGNGKIKELSSELQRLTSDIYQDYKEFHHFERNEYRKALEWLQESYDCPTCRNIKTPWCEVLKCEKIDEKESLS